MKSLQMNRWIGMVLLMAATRLIPHPPNFTPIAAMALFSSAFAERKSVAFSLPLLTLLVGDLFIGLHPLIPFVYGSVALTTWLGLPLRHNQSPGRIAATSFASSILFFLLTNLGNWMVFDSYPKTLPGLAACYAAGLPYFGNTVAGDFCYTLLLFGLWKLISVSPSAHQPAESCERMG